MTDQESDRKQEIEALLAERKKFEAWLAQLEAKRASASAHVFDRVFADYSKRLEEVRSRLINEADALKSLVGDLETRLGKEQDKVNKKTDERAEAELRAMVGEYSDKEWATTKSKLDSAINDLRAKFDGTERELADLKELLGSVTGAPAPARPSMMIAAEATVAEALHTAEHEAAPVEPAEAPAPDALAPEPVKAEEPAPEVVAAPETKPESKPEEPKPAPKPEHKFDPKTGARLGAKAEPKTAEPPARKSTPFDELAFLRSVAGTPSRPSGTAAVPAAAPVPTMPEPPLIEEPEPEAAADSEPEAVVEDSSSPRARASAKVEEGAPLGGPTPRTSQAIRSLKCQECGTLNFPTEWYCERCGGELAAF
jgi:hypothetical protein